MSELRGQPQPGNQPGPASRISPRAGQVKDQDRRHAVGGSRPEGNSIAARPELGTELVAFETHQPPRSDRRAARAGSTAARAHTTMLLGGGGDREACSRSLRSDFSTSPGRYPCNRRQRFPNAGRVGDGRPEDFASKSEATASPRRLSYRQLCPIEPAHDTVRKRPTARPNRLLPNQDPPMPSRESRLTRRSALKTLGAPPASRFRS